MKFDQSLEGLVWTGNEEIKAEPRVKYEMVTICDYSLKGWITYHKGMNLRFASLRDIFYLLQHKLAKFEPNPELSPVFTATRLEYGNDLKYVSVLHMTDPQDKMSQVYKNPNKESSIEEIAETYPNLLRDLFSPNDDPREIVRVIKESIHKEATIDFEMPESDRLQPRAIAIYPGLKIKATYPLKPKEGVIGIGVTP